MKRAIVIGATGHVGSYLIPELVKNGYDVCAVSRGIKQPYTAGAAEWKEVHTVKLDRHSMNEHEFGEEIVKYRPDLVCDLTAYTLDDAKGVAEALMRSAENAYLIQIGSIWIYGDKYEVPVPEDHPRTDSSVYGRGKAGIEAYLLGHSREGKLRATVIHPGHISGCGWLPINPQGNLNPQVYLDIIAGSPVLLPGDGMYTLHHVHSQDIASLITACIKHKPYGEAFHAVAERAVTLRGFAKMLYEYYRHKEETEFAPWTEFTSRISKTDADITLDHISRSPVCSMKKAQTMLGFTPQYSIIETVTQSLAAQAEIDERFKIALKKHTHE